MDLHEIFMIVIFVPVEIKGGYHMSSSMTWKLVENVCIFVELH